MTYPGKQPLPQNVFIARYKSPKPAWQAIREADKKHYEEQRSQVQRKKQAKEKKEEEEGRVPDLIDCPIDWWFGFKRMR
jgi:hypothetical protein